MRILCVHPNVELYGSDRSFVDATDTMKAAHPGAEVSVVLPCEGPILSLLSGRPIGILFEKLWVLRKATLLTPRTWDPRSFLDAVKRAKALCANSALVYVNTVVLPDYLLAIRSLRPGKGIVHVREIPSSRLMAAAFSALLRWSRGTVIFNSQATRRAFRLSRGQRSHVIYNGVSPPTVRVDPPAFHGDRPLRLLLLGRINGWKGQDLLIEACARLAPEERSKLEIRIVGSHFEGREQFSGQLMALISRHELGSIVKVESFDPDPSTLYVWADLVVVPSKSPEPFGRVAIEAMACARGVLASAAGGLVEIVENGESGILFQMGDVGALASAIRYCLNSPERVQRFGRNGRRRFDRMFDLKITSGQLYDVFNSALSAHKPFSFGQVESN